MADLPEVGLNAVLDNLDKFQKGADSVVQAYDDINAGADTVEDTTGAASGALSLLGGTASTVASGGMTLLVGAIAAVVAAAAGAVVSLGLMAKASFDLSSDTEASQKNIQSQLGATTEEAEKLGDIATEVWSNNFAGSVEEATDALIETRKQLKGISDEELQDATENAIRLSDAFGIDIAESTNSANVLMEQFGLSQQEAFDFITKGFQDGLNSSDDFLDSISEYGGLFGQAGGDAGQFFSLLETGLAGGVLGTDKAADAFKEFSIRIIDGSDTTSAALDELFSIVDGVGGEIAELKNEYDQATVALDNNTEALEESEGAFTATKQIVDELEAALGDARRELDELSRPNLAGMQEFDDTLFELEQQSNQARLALLDMTPDTKEFEAAQQQLDAINKEMDKVALQRDIQFEPQLRAIEKAAEEGTEPLTTYDQVMAAIGEKKTEIAGLEGAFNSANAEMIANEQTVNALTAEQDRLVDRIAFLKTAMENASGPSKEFLDGFTDGSLNGVDAFSEVIKKLGEIEDPVKQNQIAVELFGTQFEDLGADAALAIDLAKTSLEDLGGATDTLNAQYETLPQAFEGVKRKLLLAIAPIGDSILEAANEIMPLLFDAIEDLKPALEDFADVIGDSVTAAVQELIPWIQETLVPALQDFGKWLVSTGIPALKDFAKFIWNDVIPAIVTFAEWIGEELIPFIQDLWKLFKTGKKRGKIITKAFDDILESIEPLVKKVLPELLEIWEIIRKWTIKNWPLIKKTIETVMEAIQDIIEKVTKNIQKFWEKWGDEIMKITEFIFDSIFKLVKTALENTLSVITAIMKVITGDWKGAWEEIEKITKNLTNAIVSIAKDAFELMKNLISGIMDDLADSISDIWNQIKSNVEKIVTNMINSIVSKIKNSASTIKDALISMFNNAIDTVASVIGNLNSVISMVTNLINAIKAQIVALWTLIRDGFQLSINLALSAFDINNILNAISALATNIMNNIKARLIALWDLIRDGINIAITTAVDLLLLPLAALKNVGENIIQGVIDGIEDAKQTLKTILEGVANLIPQWLADWLGIGSGAKLLRPIGMNAILGIQEGIASQIPSLLNQLQNQVAAPMVAAPAMAAGSTTNVTQIFNTGGNTVANDMDAAVFEQRVLQVIRNNL